MIRQKIKADPVHVTRSRGARFRPSHSQKIFPTPHSSGTFFFCKLMKIYTILLET